MNQGPTALHNQRQHHANQRLPTQHHSSSQSRVHVNAACGAAGIQVVCHGVKHNVNVRPLQGEPCTGAVQQYNSTGHRSVDVMM